MGPLSRAVTACRPVGDSDSSADCPRGASRAIFALAAGEDAIPAPARAIGAGRLPADKLLDTWRSSDSDHWHHCAPRARDRRAVRACVRPRRAEREQGGDGRRVALRRRGLVAPPRRESPPDSACWQSHDHRWRMTTDGVLVIDSREHRTQGQNREAARARLVALIQKAAIRPRKRRPTKPGRAAKERRLAAKKRRADVKGMRGRPLVNED